VRISKTKSLRSPSFSLWISKATYLEHIAPIVIFIYLFCRIGIACRKCLFCTPMLGFDPTSVENRIWGDGIETNRCDAEGSRLLSDVTLEACG
jgi:hypothetical protein